MDKNHSTIFENLQIEENQLSVKVCEDDKDYSNLQNIDVVFISFNINHGKYLRKELFSLNNHFNNLNIADFGNVIIGKEIEAIEVINELIASGIVVVLLDGINSVSQFFPPITMSKWINSGKIKSDRIENPDYIGFQRQLFDWTHLMDIEKNSPDSISLGLIRADFNKLEPLLRNTQNIIIELSALKSAYCPNTVNSIPTGLTPEELCQICRYAGNSNEINLLAYNFELNSESRNSLYEYQIVANSLWYFLEGLDKRVIENPSSSDSGFNIFYVYLKDYEDELEFYQSVSSGLCWLKISDNNSDLQFIPCTYEDYVVCTKGEMPERIFRYLHMN